MLTHCELVLDIVIGSSSFDKKVKDMKDLITTGLLLVVAALATAEIKPCPGDTRGDRRCNHDPTHRVCAKVRTF